MKANTESSEIIKSTVEQVSKIVSQMAGIQLGPRQFSMVENRLRTRMLRLEIESFSEYLTYLKQNQEDESLALVSLMTTHHTYFFREFSHFEYLLNKSLDKIVEKSKARGDKKIRIWSAASSRGQEAYSLAMFFKFHLESSYPGIDFEIWGTDIDQESVKHAENGVYKAEELKKSPAMYIGDNWIRGKGEIKDFVKIKQDLKKKCHFQVANLLDCQSFLKDKNFDIIFCRNVFIYFNSEQIKKCTSDFLSHLDHDGFLFLGVSESLNGLSLKVNSTGPSVYQHQKTVVQTINKLKTGLNPGISATPSASAFDEAVPEKEKVLQVLCVDDSGAILKLLTRILTKEHGFEVKATAVNGLDALDKIKSQKFDVITLDMHMPELDGIGFLERSKDMDRPPVIIVSSINRDDTSIAQKAIKLGAADYVEKPSLENIAEASNEIRSKLKLAFKLNGKNNSSALKSLTSLSNNSIEPETVNSKSIASSERAVLSKKKVLIVDDSKTIRQILTKIISEDPMLEVIAQTENPLDVEDLILKHKPDVITLDIHMPQMDGVTLLKKINARFSIPCVMISSISKEEGTQVLDALEAGAIDYIQKPQMSDLREVSIQIQERIKTAAQVKVKKRSKNITKSIISNSLLDKQNLIVIGSSTGGTEALKEILQSLPKEIPPILIVQHIPPVFSAAFAKRLNDLCPFEVKEAEHGDEIKPNRVIIAQGAKQMGIKALKDKLIISVNDDPPMNRHKPSVDYLFSSASNLGSKKIVAVILTGMGADGAKMMKKLRDQGVRTIAQDKETCVVFGMPREAIEMNAAEFILPLEKIGNKILDLCSSNNFKKTA